jgi:hypothetical protein
MMNPSSMNPTISLDPFFPSPGGTALFYQIELRGASLIHTSRAWNMNLNISIGKDRLPEDPPAQMGPRQWYPVTQVTKSMVCRLELLVGAQVLENICEQAVLLCTRDCERDIVRLVLETSGPRTCP